MVQGIVVSMDKPLSSQLRRGVVGPCILALLETGPHYGLEIVDKLNAAGQLLTSQGTVYPLLNRLSDADLVRSSWVVNEEERPRRYYTLTPTGKKELTAFQSDWASFARAVSTIMRTAEPEVSEGAHA